MTGFSSRWLEVREPIDHAARSETVVSALCHYFLNQDSLRITDIGSGTGSTLRALKPFLQNVSWHLIDNDKALIDEATRDMKDDTIKTTICDLSSDLQPITEDNPDLVTTSAFLDLVSKGWLEQLVQDLVSRKIPFYAALTYDGSVSTEPSHEAEAAVIEAFNLHQKTDKGFGPALGPNAAATALSMFEDAGYLVTSDSSDWNADCNHAEFQRILLEGWKTAAGEIKPDKSHTFEAWYLDRLAHINRNDLNVRVGHLDFLAVPAINH